MPALKTCEKKCPGFNILWCCPLFIKQQSGYTCSHGSKANLLLSLSKLMPSVHIIHNNKPYDECKGKTNLDHYMKTTFSFEIPSCYLHYCLVKALGCIFYSMFICIINPLGDSQLRTSVSLPSASLRKYSAELKFHQRSTRKKKTLGPWLWSVRCFS